MSDSQPQEQDDAYVLRRGLDSMSKHAERLTRENAEKDQRIAELEALIVKLSPGLPHVAAPTSEPLRLFTP